MLKSFTSSHSHLPRQISVALTSLAAGLVLGWAGMATAQTEPAAPPPVELTDTLTQIDAAATARDVDAVMEFYSPNFTSDDGLTHDTLEDSLEQFWDRFEQISYTTELTQWQQEGEALIAETKTTITATQTTEEREFELSATIVSRQRFEGGQIVQQDVLSEQSQLTSGNNPPTVMVNLPEQVRPGEEFAFDAIVEEPLGNQYLMGAAVDELASTDAVANPASIDLELLTAGGLFKVGVAPDTTGDRWISSAIVRQDGITVTSRRLRVAE